MVFAKADLWAESSGLTPKSTTDLFQLHLALFSVDLMASAHNLLTLQMRFQMNQRALGRRQFRGLAEMVVRDAEAALANGRVDGAGRDTGRSPFDVVCDALSNESIQR